MLNELRPHSKKLVCNMGIVNHVCKLHNEKLW